MNKQTIEKNIVITDEWIREKFPNLEVITLSKHRLNVYNRNNKNFFMDITLPHDSFNEEAIVKWPGAKQTFTNIKGEAQGKVEEFSPWSDDGEVQVSSANWQEWVVEWFNKISELK